MTSLWTRLHLKQFNSIRGERPSHDSNLSKDDSCHEKKDMPDSGSLKNDSCHEIRAEKKDVTENVFKNNGELFSF